MDLIIPRSSVWGHQHQAPANDRPPAQVELSPNPLQALCFWRHGRRVPAPELRRRPQTASIGPCALRQRTSSASSIALRHIPAAARSRRSPLRRKGETSELSKKNHVVPRSFRRSGEIASRPSTACNRGLVLDLIGFVEGGCVGRVAGAAERRDHVKALFNSFDMDGTLGAWRRRMGLRDGERPSAGMVIAAWGPTASSILRRTAARSASARPGWLSGGAR